MRLKAAESQPPSSRSNTAATFTSLSRLEVVVCMVAAGCLGGVYVRGGNEFWAVVCGHDDLPFGMVDEPVVLGT